MATDKVLIHRKFLLWLLIGAAVLFFIYSIKSILLPFVIGILAAYLLDPAADKLEKSGLSRTLSTMIITILFFLVAASIIAVLTPVIFEQITSLIGKLPDFYQHYSQRLSPVLKKFLERINYGGENLNEKAILDKTNMYFIDFSKTLFGNIWQSGLALLNLISLILITPVVTFHLLKEWDNIIARLDSYLPVKHAKTIRTQVKEIDRVMSGFLHGQFNVCLIMAIVYAISLMLTGLDFGLLIGVMTGLLTFIPYAGFFVGFVTAIAVAFFQFGDSWQHIGFVIAAMMFGQALESYFITPRLVGAKVDLHPLWLIFGMLAGAALFGTVGIFIAVPATAIIGVLIKFFLKKYKTSPLYKS